MIPFRTLLVCAVAALVAFGPGLQAQAMHRAGTLTTWVDDASGTDPGLVRIRARDEESGLTFSVYHDRGSAKLASANVQYLASAYLRVAELVGVAASEATWAAVVFSQDPGYRPSTNLDGETRWKVAVAPDGSLGAQGEHDLYIVVPHEQAHATQRKALPRWFAEGQAEWAGLKVAEAWRPALAKSERERTAKARAEAKEPLALSRWGGLVVKPEAIERQLTPEQRKRLETDPDDSWMSKLSFSFFAGDYVSDESNTVARYGAALALFDKLEAKAGMPAMRAWFRHVRELPADSGGKIRSDAIAGLASKNLDTDIAPDLR